VNVSSSVSETEVISTVSVVSVVSVSVVVVLTVTSTAVESPVLSSFSVSTASASTYV
jgi:hypothetical protein